MIKTLIDNQMVWDLIYKLLTRLLSEDRVIAGFEANEDIQALSTKLDIDPELVLAIVELIAKIYDWWRNRK